MALEIQMLPGELRAFGQRLVGLDEVLDTMRAERQEALTFMGKVDGEIESARRILEDALDKGQPSSDEVRQAVRLLQRAEQYMARLKPRQKVAVQAEISLRSMVKILRESLAKLRQ